METKIKDKEIKRVVNIFSANSVLNSLGNTIIGNTYILFISNTKGFSDGQISLIVGILPLITVVTFFVWGIIIDKYKRLLLINKFVNIVNITTLAGLVWVDNFYLFFILNLIRNVLMQPGGVVNEEYLLNLSNKYGVTFGKIRVFSTIGFGLAGAICAIALRFMSPEKTIMISSIFIIANIIVLFFLPEITKPPREDDKGEKVKIKELFKNNDYRIFILTFSLLTAVICSSTGYGVPMILIKLNAPNFYIGMLPILMISFEAILLPCVEKFEIYKNVNRVLRIACLFLIIRWTIIGMANSYMIIVVVTLMHGIINGLLIPLPNKVIWDVVPKEDHSTAIIMNNLFSFTIFPGIINLITGYIAVIYGVHSYGFVYLALTLVSLGILIKFKINNRAINE
ncbi:MFS transporter [Clostridium sp. SHJSY1]|uniref:MFS transporter n=1 Tax=Clostridium sp. SHJSY1 TaxID=2942483 RepID=UPI002875C7FC|nr:MFS transporter [Clostridium sp. SHJSY1]MDS0524824.1 MFS transporter [Clostridium sp. SHJSY1]